MALDREIEVGARHPGPIVGNANEPPPAAVGRDLDPGGAGIKRILDQFLDHARRAFATSPAAMRLTVVSESWRTGIFAT